MLSLLAWWSKVCTLSASIFHASSHHIADVFTCKIHFKLDVLNAHARQCGRQPDIEHVFVVRYVCLPNNCVCLRCRFSAFPPKNYLKNVGGTTMV
jgi:hypothetical protein